MNHKEALQKIVGLKPNNQSTINESLTEWANNVLNIATEALQSDESRIYKISFDNHLQAEISVNSNCIEVLKAVNGWGDSVIKEKITIEPIRPKTPKI